MEQLLHTRAALPRPRDGAALRFLYHTPVGRLLLKPLCARPVSRLCGRFLDSPLSKILIRPFVRRNGIRLEDFGVVTEDGYEPFTRVSHELRCIPC